MRFSSCILLFGLAAGLNAQWLNYKDSSTPRTKDGKPNLSGPIPRSANGKPDLSGVWQGDGAPIPELMKILPSGTNGLGEDIPPMSFFNVLAGFKPEDNPMTPEVAAQFQKMSKVALTEPPPVPLCSPPPTPFADSFPGPFKIVQTPKLTLMLYEPDTFFRQIFTDGRKHPDDPQPSWLGYSTGKWEGEDFVVSTIGLIQLAPLDVLGHPHSDALKVTERFHRKDFGHMDLHVTIDDPKMYTKAFTYTVPLHLLPDTDLLESFCSEHEKDEQHMVRKNQAF